MRWRKARKIASLLCLFIFMNALTYFGTGWVRGEAMPGTDTEKFVRLPFDGSAANIGTSGVTPVTVGSLPAYATGYASKALNFDTDYTKVNASNPAPYLDLGDHPDLKFGADTDFTISFWIKFPNTWKTDGWPVLITNKNQNSEVGWRILTDTYENIRWQLTVEGYGPLPEVTVHRILDTNWHHFAVTLDRDGFARFYVDGQEAADKAVDLSGMKGSVDTALTPKIGVNASGLLANQTRDKLNVQLDDLRIYRKALNATEVLQLKQQTSSLLMMEHVDQLKVGDFVYPKTYVMFQNKVLSGSVQGIHYESSNPSVATINPDGGIEVIATGETTIRASYEGLSDSFVLQAAEVPDIPEWQSQLSSEHPRLLATEKDFAKLLRKIEKDERAGKWFLNIKQQGEGLLASSTFNGNDPQRILLLGMLYHLTQDSRYSERAWLEMEHLMGQVLWDPDMFLEHAARLMSASFAYDWFYNVWDENRRERLKADIIEKGMLPGIITYRLGANAPYATNYWNGAVTPYPESNNWNTVGNAGQLISALAIGEDSPSFAGEILDSGMVDILQSLEHFNPHGGWFEGYAYWNYTWIYVSRLLASIDTALGPENNPLSSFPGIAESGYFPIHLSGSTGKSFDFGDSGTGIGDNEQMYYLANRYNKPELTQFQLPYTEAVPAIDPLSLLWYNPHHTGGSKFGKMPLDKRYPGIEIGSLRAAWNDRNAVSVNFKAGTAQNGHMDLDAGTFVLDALGERWFADLGDRNRAEWPNFFSTYGPRWTYYTKRAEGHNTLVINPKPATGVAGDPDQTYVYGADYRPYIAPIEQFESKDTNAYAIMDLTKSYGNHSVTSVRRGIALLDDRSHVLLQDEVGLAEPGEIYSFLHFNGKAGYELSEDGKSAILTIDDKRLWVGLLGGEDPDMLTVMDAKPLSTSPNPAIQYSKPGKITEETPVKKLAVHLTDRQDARIALYIVPLKSGEPLPQLSQLPPLAPLKDWESSFERKSQIFSPTT